MKTCASRVLIALAALLLAGTMTFAQTASPPIAEPGVAQEKTPGVENTTLENLMDAFQGESNAHARYLAFAKKAEEEGYMPIASLFRAAGRAEQIHAAAHAKVIVALGGKAEPKLEKVEIKSTKENLEAAIKGESYERDTMYPKFVKKAKADKNTEAVRTLNFALTAEGEHARLFTEAKDKMDAWKGTQKKTFFVCKVCGYTVTTLDFSKCFSCFSPKEEYEQVS